jgi:hypothetical protein
MHEEENRHLYWTSPSSRAIVKAAWEMHEGRGVSTPLLDIALIPCYCQSHMGHDMHGEEYRYLYRTSLSSRAIVKAAWDMSQAALTIAREEGDVQ